NINATEVVSTDSTILPDNEEEIHQVDGEIIDLAPYIKENIILNIPFRVFSEEEVIDEGKDWSYFTEDEKIESDSDKIDPRLEKLQLLLDKEDNGEIIDLATYITENIILNIPFRVFSEEEVIDEGKDWSYFTEDEKIESDSDKIDPRLEKLQLLLDKEDKTK